MKNRTAFALAATAATLSLQLIVLALILPRPAVANDLASPPARIATAGRADPLVERGRYVAMLGGCHDCHTDGYAEAAGEVPTERWLTGKSVGFKGPWGVSYPTNLRLSVQALSEQQWMGYARAPRLPPMPWFNLRDMADEDLRALYRFLRSIGPSGEAAPRPVGPDAVVATPFINFVPQTQPVTAAR
jgi:mono/diheme cytochrome c family protein